jgi:putative ABC transport system ATP-binding protein
MPIQLYQVKKVYVGPDGSTVPVIDIDSLTLNDGEQVALIGSSGSGKTTLLHMIAGILTPDSGSIIFDLGGAVPSAGISPLPSSILHPPSSSAIDIATLSEPQRDIFRGRNIGYIFQTHHLLPGFTALENVLLGMSFTGRKADHAWGEHLLKEVGLADRLHYKPGKLSVGQQQRVAAARALANRPKLVLADEPTGALDPNNANQVLELVRSLCRQVQATLLLVTHDMQIANQLQRTLRLSELNRAMARV